VEGQKLSNSVGSGRVGDELAVSAARFFVMAIVALAVLARLLSVSGGALP
jgi:hypothetical protein